jgi:hypothetical protein
MGKVIPFKNPNQLLSDDAMLAINLEQMLATCVARFGAQTTLDAVPQIIAKAQADQRKAKKAAQNNLPVSKRAAGGSK